MQTDGLFGRFIQLNYLVNKTIVSSSKREIIDTPWYTVAVYNHKLMIKQTNKYNSSINKTKIIYYNRCIKYQYTNNQNLTIIMNITENKSYKFLYPKMGIYHLCLLKVTNSRNLYLIQYM